MHGIRGLVRFEDETMGFFFLFCFPPSFLGIKAESFIASDWNKKIN